MVLWHLLCAKAKVKPEGLRSGRWTMTDCYCCCCYYWSRRVTALTWPLAAPAGRCRALGRADSANFRSGSSVTTKETRLSGFPVDSWLIRRYCCPFILSPLLATCFDFGLSLSLSQKFGPKGFWLSVEWKRGIFSEE